VPDLLHVVPVGDDAVLDRVLEREDATLRLGLVADVRWGLVIFMWQADQEVTNN